MSDEIEYKIKITPWYRWQGDYGWDYSSDEDHEYEISDNSIEELYESVARDYNHWIVQAEEASKKPNCADYDRMENKGVKYSPIYVEVEPYSEEKRNATKAYKEVGEVRDRFIANKKVEEEKERIPQPLWRPLLERNDGTR